MVIPPGAQAAGYVVRMSANNAYKVSHDNGKTYLGYSSTNGNWDVDTRAGYTNGRTITFGLVGALCALARQRSRTLEGKA